MTRIELDDGKYTVVHDSGAGLHALRYGEHWRDMTGDGLVLAMAQEIEDLRRRIAPVQQVSVPDGWKLVPVEPTPEMVCAAEEAHMPFGDMDIALRMAILSAPSAPATVQGVNQQLLEALEELMYAHTDKAEALATAAIAAARKGEGE